MKINCHYFNIKIIYLSREMLTSKWNFENSEIIELWEDIQGFFLVYSKLQNESKTNNDLTDNLTKLMWFFIKFNK